MKTFIEILKGIVVKLGGTTKNNSSEFGVIKAIEEAVGAFATNTQNSINSLVEDVTAVEDRVTALEEGGGGEIPVATAETLGGVKIGDGININDEGVISTSSVVGRIETISTTLCNIVTNHPSNLFNIYNVGYSNEITDPVTLGMPTEIIVTIDSNTANAIGHGMEVNNTFTLKPVATEGTSIVVYSCAPFVTGSGTNGLLVIPYYRINNITGGIPRAQLWVEKPIS